MRKKLLLGFITTLCLTAFAGCSNTASKGTEDTAPNVEKTFLEEKELWKDSQNLYEISLDALAGVSQPEVYKVGNDLLVTYTEYDKEEQKFFYYLKLIGLDSGDVLQEQRLDALTYPTVQVLDEGIGVYDFAEGKSYLLDASLQLKGEYTLEGGRFCMNHAGDRIYSFTYDAGITVLNLETGEETTLLGDARNMYMYEADEEAVFSYIDKNTLMCYVETMDLGSEETQKIDSVYTYFNVESAGDVWLGQVENKDFTYVVGTKENQEEFCTQESTLVSLNEASGQIMVADTNAEGIPYLSVYDASGKCLSYCETTGLENTLYYDPVWYEEYNGYVFTLMDDSGDNHLLFWDISVDSEGEDLVMSQVTGWDTIPEGDAVSNEYYDRAKQISDTYGVQILIADQCDTVFSDHTAELLLTENDIELALDTIEYVLGLYPEGIFTQMKYGTYQEIEIQVLGSLVKDVSTEEEQYVSGGFVSTDYPGKILMALDARGGYPGETINSILSETMYHEFSHIIDRRLEYASLYREDMVYSEEGWLELNPGDFEYDNTYFEMAAVQYADYFVDSYACTFSTEDRARIMEFAMAGDVETFAGKEGLIRKLEYYCGSIRDGFDTTGWPEETPWEKTLNEVK